MSQLDDVREVTKDWREVEATFLGVSLREMDKSMLLKVIEWLSKQWESERQAANQFRRMTLTIGGKG